MDISGLRSDRPTYDRATIWLHWATALLVVCLWLLGQTIDWFPAGFGRVAARSTHISLGITLVVVLTIRLTWRLSAGRHLPPADTGVMRVVSGGAHLLLYALAICTVLAGLANVWVRGDNVFGLFSVPALDPGDKALRATVGEIHSWLADGILILAGLHALAALVHHFVLRDGVLRRMVPRLP